MTPQNEYVAILRCQTWNTWPEGCIAENRSLVIDHGSNSPLQARLAIISYKQRAESQRYVQEPTANGPLLWDGKTTGLHCVRDTILKAPEDNVFVEWQYRNADRGEVDICINFRHPGEIPQALLEALRATASAIASLINLAVQDFLIPTLPFQLLKVLPEGGGRGGQMKSSLLLAVHDRKALTQPDVHAIAAHVTSALRNSTFGPRLVNALELYAAHFREQQVRVRFLLLVIAMESLSSASKKHEAATSLLRRWEDELTQEMACHASSSEAWLSLDALRRELGFRSDDSVRAQVRKLFAALPGLSSGESIALQRRALRVYDKRSTLVHDGHLPEGELIALEGEARELLEKILISAIEDGRIE